MKKLLVHSTVIFALCFSACQKKTETVAPSAADADKPAAENLETGKPVVTDQGVFTINLLTDPPEPQPGQNTDLVFEIKSPTGEVVRRLQIVHEKQIHLIVVSEDLSEFYHLHPEPEADGTFKTSFAFPNAGKYRVYADFTPLGANPVVQNFTVSVAGQPRPPQELKPDTEFQKTVDSLRVVMKPDGALASQKDLMLNFSVFDAKTNQPVGDLENYLGAKAHFVIISQDLADFVHAHPMSADNLKSNAASADRNHDASHAHSGESPAKLMSGAATAATVSAHVSFPKGGIYKIWAQFQRAGKVINVPFVVNVEASREEKGLDTSQIEIPKGYFKILVTKDGFTPNNIELSKNVPIKLAFYRADAENCGTEVVFKNLNITKKLPLKQTVLVELPAGTDGEIDFSCGMNMFKGKIVAQ